MSRTLAIAITLLGGCLANHGDEGMVVVANTAPAVGGTGCTLTGDPMQPSTTHGIITAESPTPYLLTPLVQSRITPIENGDPLQRTILFSGARIDLSVASASANGAAVTITLPSNHFKELFSGSLPPLGDANVSFDLIPLDDIQAIATQTSAGSTNSVSVEVVGSVVVFGTLAGDEIDAAPFTYGVTVCTDCVVNDVGSCATFTGTPRTGNPCNPFQDGIVDCCDGAGGLVCPAVMSM